VLLDCGINHAFDFSKYRENANELRDVQLVLISHSASEYSGAYPFLVSELGISPKIVYTTQPIMRYSPLNLHEEILNLRLPAYNKKIFNRIYSEYEEMNLVKPYQKKEL
jgi:Cft2 family RNA processing exonuclease